MPRAYFNRRGEYVKRCTRCKKVKPATTDFFTENYSSGVVDQLDQRCKLCKAADQRPRETNFRQRGTEIKIAFMISRNGCEFPGCVLDQKFVVSHLYLFDIDHIDPRNKIERETEVTQIAKHPDRFAERSKFFRVFCTHHHRIHTADQHKFGNILYEIAHAESPNNLQDSQIEQQPSHKWLVLPGMESFVNPLT